MEDAVVCLNVVKRFGRNLKKNRVLNGFSIKIPKGKIFSLLGPSGCGKTTLLRCILGDTCVDSGYLSVFGEYPHAGPWIGYMPQSTSLSDNLTVDETLWLYGRLTGMSAKRTKERAEVMLRLLSITAQQYSMVGTLSGGEKRRVSFAVALLNEAPLLILDEPTVGVDPTLRQSIWEYLLIIVQCTNTTVIITTHYIEEARNSDYVGFMHEGHLMAYSSPNRLMSKYQCPTLEDVFLHLNLSNTEDIEIAASLNDAHLNESSETADDIEHLQNSTSNKSRIDTDVKLNRKFKMSGKTNDHFSRVFILIRKWQMELVHSPGVIAALILFPAIIYSLGPMVDGGKPHDINIGVVNKDSGDFGQKFINAMDNDIIKKISYYSYEAAMRDVRLGKLFGVVMFMDNVTTSIDHKNQSTSIDDATIHSNIYVSLDKTSE